jgi:hypothetical protein
MFSHTQQHKRGISKNDGLGFWRKSGQRSAKVRTVFRFSSLVLLYTGSSI